jgi:hypothetical protein
MEKYLNGCLLKYEHGNVWSWRKKNYWLLRKGTKTWNGYKVIRINNKNYYYHRIVYWLNNENWDIEDNSMNNYIDHIDNCKSNNELSNLRCVSHQHNLFNQNALGYSLQGKKYVSRLCVNGKFIYLGSHETEEQARDAYLEGKKKYHIIATNNS